MDDEILAAALQVVDIGRLEGQDDYAGGVESDLVGRHLMPRAGGAIDDLGGDGKQTIHSRHSATSDLAPKRKYPQ